MSTEQQGALTLAALRQARLHRAAVVRRVVPIGLATVIVLSARAQPAPGLDGVSLGISLALAGLVASAIAALASGRSLRIQVAVPAVMLLSSSALTWLQPGGPGPVGLIFAIAYGGQLLPARRSPATTAAATVAVALVLSSVAAAFVHRSAVSVPAIIALVTTVVMLVLGRRIRDQDEQADQMLMELEQTRGAEVRAAALAERQRLAREMHDILAHSLSGLVMQLEGARLLAAGDPSDPRLRGTIDRAQHLARNGLDEARRAISMLRDDDLPGPERIEAMAAEFARDGAIPCEFTTEGTPREISSETRLALYRVTQEALTNIRKHAHPERVLVCLRYEPQAITFTVEDVARASTAVPAAGTTVPAAGTTVPAAGTAVPASVASGNGHGELTGDLTVAGYGLTGMRERAELLGGTLTAGPTARGFRVALRVPG